MLFNSMAFLLFFPIVTLIYFLIPFDIPVRRRDGTVRRVEVRYLWLLAASYYFYCAWSPVYALLMLLSTCITYLSGLGIGRSRTVRGKKWVVVLSFLSNLSILFFFKYFYFAVDNLNALLSFLGMGAIHPRFNVMLPVGISFYTFQALSYTMDVYRKELPPERNFFKYALFVSFFPQLVAGPIERSKNLVHQISEKHVFNYERARSGLLLMLWGFFQKLVIADRAALLVDTVYNAPLDYGAVPIILATVLFAFQIYCDFGSYSNIAVGAARVMGFRVMENFDTPYFSQSVGEFWRRWHISLSTWFRDYLYIPLGGNRKGKWRGRLNILIVFLVSGLWHGASWNYVMWGGLNGGFQVIGSILAPVRRRWEQRLRVDTNAFSHKLHRCLGTFLLINFTWIFFRASSAQAAFLMVRELFTAWNPWVLFDGTLFTLGLGAQDMLVLFVSLLILFGTSVCKYKKISLPERLQRQGLWLRWSIYLLAKFAVLIFGIYGPLYDANQFIYFQF